MKTVKLFLKRNANLSLSAARVALAFALVSASLPVNAREITVPSGRILTIQQGVDAAASGDTVIVLPGTYTNPEVGKDWPPFVFIGADKTGLKLRAVGAPGSVKLVGSGLGTGIHVEADNVLVEGFDISGLVTAISGVASRGVRITRNQIHDCSSAGITLSGASNFELDGNTVKGGEYGIFLNGWPGAGPNVLHHIHHNRVSAAQTIGIFLWNSPGCELDHNECSDNGQMGIYLASSPNGTVENNRAGHNDWVGILLGNSANCAVRGNETHENGSFGILVGGSCGSALEGNVAQSNGEYDLFAPNWESAPDCNTYQNNRADTAWPSLTLWDVH